MRQSDDGVAMITVMLFLGVATTLTVAMSAVVLDSTKSTNRDRQALSALSTAEGGVAQAVQIIRANAPAFFSCHEPATNSSPSGSCLTNTGWTSSASPELVSLPSGSHTCVTGESCYEVWIATLGDYNPSSTDATDPITKVVVKSHTVQYRIHSTGVSGGGPATRSLEVDVAATLANFPLGVYADTVHTNGDFSIHHESIFSEGCVPDRNKVSFDPVVSGTYSGYDWASDEPQSVHSASYISTSGTCTKASSSIHSSAACNSSFPYDQDLAGATLSGSDTSCYNVWKSPQTGDLYTTTSNYNLKTLESTGFTPMGLTPSEYDALKQQAEADGTYDISEGNVNARLSAVSSSTAVLYSDDGQISKLGPGDIPSKFFRATTSTGLAPNGDLSSCGYQSLIIVIRQGDLTMNTNGSQPGDLVASIFVPEGNYRGQGNDPILGTLFAYNAYMTGTQDFYLDQCFVNNPPSLLLDLRQVRYHEVDTANIQ